MASPRMDVRLSERVRARVLAAAKAEGLTTSAWVRRAVLDRLDGVDSEASERAAVLKEARAFLAVGPGDSAVDRDFYGLVQRYVAALETVAGRICLAEARGRARALAEIAAGALEPIDGQELTYAEFRPDGPPVVLETTTPRRRGFLREQLARERARALLQVAPAIPPAPSPTALLGEQRARQLFNDALRWPGWKRLFCPTHGIVPSAPSSGGLDGERCYLGCTIPTTGNGSEVA